MTSLPPEPSGSSVLPRHLLTNVTTALLDTRVVGVVGPRQAGKSTLVCEIVTQRPDATYASLDDADVRALATADPRGFVEGRPGLFVIDEIQRAPELLLAIKATWRWPAVIPKHVPAKERVDEHGSARMSRR